MLIAVAGAGYVGLSSALAFAVSGHDVRVFDRDHARVDRLRRGEDPLAEPFVEELLGTFSDMTFTTDPRAAFRGVDAVAVAVGTPTTSRGEADISQLLIVADTVAREAPQCHVLIRSTVPVGTGDRLRREALRRFRVVANPEFLREGHAIEDALYPDRIVGGGDAEDEPLVRALYEQILEQRFPPRGALVPRTAHPRLLWMDRRSAELAKYAANAFLVTKLSFVNEIANVAAAVHADIRAVTEVLASDPRIGSAYLRPGIGWGGSCFPKDTRALVAFAAESGYEFTILRAAIEQNNKQLLRTYEELATELEGRVGVRIALLGLAFKAGTADCRDSRAIALAELFLTRGWEVHAFDPGVVSSPFVPPAVQVKRTAIEAADGADAVVIATEWPSFAALNLEELRRVMRGNLVYDGRCILEPDAVAAAGLRYRGVCPPIPND